MINRIAISARPFKKRRGVVAITKIGSMVKALSVETSDDK
jgi:hypothetical protein